MSSPKVFDLQCAKLSLAFCGKTKEKLTYNYNDNYNG